MPSFRILKTSSCGARTPYTLQDVRAVIDDALLPAHFFVPGLGTLEWRPMCPEEVSWEVYRGRLLDSAQTRQRHVFEAWNIFWNDVGSRSTEPILSVKLDVADQRLHVLRSIYSYAWEAYGAEENIILSRETRKWVRELVGTIDLRDFGTIEEVNDELVCLLFQAVVGCSRLPLTSVEAPLPAFSLGKLAYFHHSHVAATQASRTPMQSYDDLVQHGLHAESTWLEKTKLLEALLRSLPRGYEEQAVEIFMLRWRALGHGAEEFAALCRSLFNEVALSPYTNFVDRALAFIARAMSKNVTAYVDFLGYLLRQICRHLTAYDLVTFHHRGANYPDALLLDAVLSAFASSLAQCESTRVQRRALRQAWLVRTYYEGLPVPDLPTSSGENRRILPAPHERVPEEQILQSNRRTKRLFETPTHKLFSTFGIAEELIRKCGADLQQAAELQELGMAVFVDRPLGTFKSAGAPDQTLMLSYEMWSRAIAGRRLEEALKHFISSGENSERMRDALRSLPVTGMPLRISETRQRPGVVSLADAARVASDFVLLRTTRRTVRALLELFDFTEPGKRFDLSYLDPAKKVLIVSGVAVGESDEGVLLIYDRQLRRRMELRVDPSQGYRIRAGIEFPRAGLQLLRIWQPDTEGRPQEHNLCDERMSILPRV